MSDLFNLSDRVAIITSGAGLLGVQHAEILADAGAHAVLIDLPRSQPAERAREISEQFGVSALGLEGDITDLSQLEQIRDLILRQFGKIDILVNNAANNPHVENTGAEHLRLENFPPDIWDADLRVGLTGAFLCSRIFGSEMAKRKGGVILNVASDLAVIAPDQRLYRKEGIPDHQQAVKPVTYSVVKAGLIGLTRYLATYWHEDGVRVNAISPGGVFHGHSHEFVQRLSHLIPLGRMARVDEYKGAVLFLCSDASSYVTGTNLIADGGRSCW